MQPQFATIEKWQEISGLGRTTTYYLISDGSLSAIKAGRRTLMRRGSRPHVAAQPPGRRDSVPAPGPKGGRMMPDLAKFPCRSIIAPPEYSETAPMLVLTYDRDPLPLTAADITLIKGAACFKACILLAAREQSTLDRVVAAVALALDIHPQGTVQ